MTKLQTIVRGIMALALIAGTTTVAIKYLSVQVSDSAKARVVTVSKELKLSQRDTASKMILEWRPIVTPPTPIPPLPTITSFTLKWDKTLITSDKVKIQIIEKVSESPKTYVFIKYIAEESENDGEYLVSNLPEGDFKPNRYIEIGCSITPKECHSLPITPLKK